MGTGVTGNSAARIFCSCRIISKEIMQLSGTISQEIMLQLGNFAAVPRQDKLRFFLSFGAWIRLELFIGQRSRSVEVCHRVFVVVNFIQRVGHVTRSAKRRRNRTSRQPHFCQALLWEVSSSLSLPPPPPPSTKRLISREYRAFSSLYHVHKIFSSGSLPWSLDSRNRTAVPWQAHGPFVRSLRFTDSSSGL